MKAKEFEEVNIRIAESQPEYETLPAFHNKDEGSMTFCFALSQDEVNRIIATNEIWFKVLTFNRPLQPIAMSCNKEDLLPQIYDIEIWETDALFTKESPVSKCSRCGGVIGKNEQVIKAWPQKESNLEYRYHQECILK